MNRMTLLIAKVKAETWIQKIKQEHQKRFMKEVADANTPFTGPTPEAAPPVYGNQPVNQPGGNQPVQAF
jgi:hypothetical protein